MKILSIISLLVIIQMTAIGQKVNKYIREKDVTRIIKTLASDDMMGRPAMIPARIEKAAAFIENEFRAIGLEPLNGIKGFRQTFSRDQIASATMEVHVNGDLISAIALSARSIVAGEDTPTRIDKSAVR